VIREFLPWNQIMNYLEAIVRVYNRYGRRDDNMYKARIKILVKAEGQRYFDEVEAEFRQIVEHDGGPHTIPQASSTAWRLLRAALAGRSPPSAEAVDTTLRQPPMPTRCSPLAGAQRGAAQEPGCAP
jgi:sulfite reductase (NADPH) hemoprotein beta-component